MSAFHSSLRALKHPATIISMGVLLLNDHVLKAQVPSALTGKLSDFAGLFFFPFVVMAFVSLPLGKLGLTARQTAQVSFGLTGVWFALAKCVPGANALTGETVELLLGYPVQIVLDPTDVMALVSLWPAWRLWQRVSGEAERVQRPAGKWGYVMLGVAALASMATYSPGGSYVYQVRAEEGVLYALVDGKVNSKRADVFESHDGGETWEESKETPAILHKSFRRLVKLPKIVCVQNVPDVCYRITGEDQVEGSQDGGTTWEVVWEVSPGRRIFGERPRFMGNMAVFNFYDLEIIIVPEGHRMLVAMGDEGILIRTANGEWQRYAIKNAIPTPLAMRGISGLGYVLLFETLLSFGIGLFIYIYCSTKFINRLAIKSERKQTGRKHQFDNKMMTFSLIGTVMLVLISIYFGNIVVIFYTLIVKYKIDFVVYFIPISIIFILLRYLPRWKKAIMLADDPEKMTQARKTITIAALGIFPVAWLPFMLWAYGTIDSYNAALALAVGLGAAALVGGIRAVRRIGRELEDGVVMEVEL